MMADFLFSRSTCDLRQECLLGKTRLSIFLITEACVGLPVLVWVLRVLYGHHKSGGRISVLAIVLLLSDLLELLLNPYIVTKLLQNDFCWETSTTCWIFTSIWSGSMIYGFYLKEVVVLEGALSLRHPFCSAHVFFPSCSIIFFITGFICFFLCELFNVIQVIILCLPLLLVIPLASCMVTCRAPPQTSDFPYRTKKPSCTVLAFSTFIMILQVTFIICVFPWVYIDLWGWVSLLSLRVITDPLLCVLIYRKNLKVQKPQTNVGTEQIYDSYTELRHP